MNEPYARSNVSELAHAFTTGHVPLPSAAGIVHRSSFRWEAPEMRCIRPMSKYRRYRSNLCAAFEAFAGHKAPGWHMWCPARRLLEVIPYSLPIEDVDGRMNVCTVNLKGSTVVLPPANTTVTVPV